LQKLLEEKMFRKVVKPCVSKVSKFESNAIMLTSIFGPEHYIPHISHRFNNFLENVKLTSDYKPASFQLRKLFIS